MHLLCEYTLKEIGKKKGMGELQKQVPELEHSEKM
jgi:hypothetical protein